MNKFSKIFIVIGGLLVLVSILLFIRNEYEDYNAGKKSLEVISYIKDIISVNNLDAIDGYNEVNSVNNDMSVTKINNYDYIGVINIPSLKLELPVINNYSEEKLRVAPVRYYGSVYTDDLIICAHSYKSHFGYLSKLVQGDKIIFTDIDGNVYIYEVLEIEILGPDDIIEMVDNEFDLTLYTCTNDSSGRITVRCNRFNNNI